MMEQYEMYPNSIIYNMTLRVYDIKFVIYIKWTSQHCEYNQSFILILIWYLNKVFDVLFDKYLNFDVGI